MWGGAGCGPGGETRLRRDRHGAAVRAASAEAEPAR
jgi:hypothetical protein